MKQLVISGRSVACDVEATRAIYAGLTLGAATDCGCPDCANYAAQRDEALPTELRELLAALGVDPTRETEVSLLGEDGEWCRYGILFHFVGALEGTGDEEPRAFECEEVPDVQVGLHAGAELAPLAFRELGVVELDLRLDLPLGPGRASAALEPARGRLRTA